MAPLIAQFNDRYPEIDIEVRLTSEVESITNDETDISLRAAHEVTDDVVAATHAARFGHLRQRVLSRKLFQKRDQVVQASLGSARRVTITLMDGYHGRLSRTQPYGMKFLTVICARA